MSRQPYSSNTEGFTLVIVLWGLGVMTLFALAIMGVTRSRVEIAANIVEATKAELLSNAGIELWRSKQGADPQFLQTQSAGDNGVQFCAMPDGAIAAIAVEDEGGKIDLNSSSPDLIARLIRSLGLSDVEAAQLADAVITFAKPRTRDEEIRAAIAYKEAGRNFGPKRAPFETVLELDQVLGVNQSLFQALVPFVTVHNRQPGFDPRRALPSLMARLNAIGSLPSEYLMPSSQRIFLIHSEVLTAGDGASAQQAIVEIGSGSEPARILEHRRAPSRYGSDLKDRNGSASIRALRPCG